MRWSHREETKAQRRVQPLAAIGRDLADHDDEQWCIGCLCACLCGLVFLGIVMLVSDHRHSTKAHPSWWSTFVAALVTGSARAAPPPKPHPPPTRSAPSPSTKTVVVKAVAAAAAGAAKHLPKPGPAASTPRARPSPGLARLLGGNATASKACFQWINGLPEAAAAYTGQRAGRSEAHHRLEDVRIGTIHR